MRARSYSVTLQTLRRPPAHRGFLSWSGRHDDCSLRTLYAERVSSGSLIEDQPQKTAIERLSPMLRRLRNHRWTPPHELDAVFSRVPLLRELRLGPRGAYVYGGVGTGKTMLMVRPKSKPKP